MTVRVDTQAAKERAERTLLAWGATGNVREEAEALARDVLALVALLADAEKVVEAAREVYNEWHGGEPRFTEEDDLRDALVAFDAAGGTGTE